MRTRSTLLLAALATLAACSGASTKKDAYAAATPDVQGLTLELQSAAAEGALAPEPAAATPQNDLLAARAVIQELNAGVRAFVDQIRAVVDAGGGAPGVGEQMRYGPADRCVVGTDPATCDKATFLVTVTHEHDNLFSWKLDAWPVGAAETAAQVVARGWIATGDVAHRGVGKLGLDLDALHAVVAAYPGQGKLLGAFASGRMGKVLTYRLYGFTPDPAVHGPAWLVLAGFRNDVTGTRRVRLATLADVVTTPTDTGPELVLAHMAWNPLVGGRSFAITTNWEDPARGITAPQGDVPGTPWNEHYYFTRSCYAAQDASLLFKQTFLCDGPGSLAPEGPGACAVRVSLGDPAAAAAGIVYPASPTATDTWANLCAVDTTAYPGMGEPSGAPDADPEAGAGMGAGDGMGQMTAPPDCPASPTDVMTGMPSGGGMGGMGGGGMM